MNFCSDWVTTVAIAETFVVIALQHRTWPFAVKLLR